MLIQWTKLILLVDLKEMKEQQYFLLLKKQKKQLLIFHKTLQVLYEMETQKIITLLNNSRNEESKFATKNGMSCDR